MTCVTLNRGQEVGMKVSDNSGARRRMKKHEFFCHLLSNFETACTDRELMFEAPVINSFRSCDCNHKEVRVKQTYEIAQLLLSGQYGWTVA
jgi:hypothetical protein